MCTNKTTHTASSMHKRSLQLQTDQLQHCTCTFNRFQVTSSEVHELGSTNHKRRWHPACAKGRNMRCGHGRLPKTAQSQKAAEHSCARKTKRGGFRESNSGPLAP